MDNEKQKLISEISRSISKNTFAKITIGKYRGDDKEFQNIFAKRIIIKEGERISFTFRYKTKDIVKNFELNKALDLITEIIGKDFFSATLFTTENDFTIDYSKKRIPKLQIKKPTYTSEQPQQHNESKRRFINSDRKYFYSLGITNSEGKVKADKYDKYRQVDKFIEILDSLYRESELPAKDEISIVDMGSGKSYLTFALYDYFTNTLNKKVVVRGIEQREDLVLLSNKIAADCEFENLAFEKQNLENLKFENADIVIALHACDTATDDAITYAINSNTKIIVLAPCCHKYVRKKLVSPDKIKGIFKHGILIERLAVSLTDGLRSLMLEHFGYATKVFEYISSEHTAKNTMITAVKKTSDRIEEDKLNEMNLIKSEYGLDDFYLDKKLFKEKH